jgi:putative ABC transport system permease protein
MLENSPFSLAYSEVGLNAHEVIDPAELKRIVAEDGFSIVREAKVAGVLIKNYAIGWENAEPNQNDSNALILSATDFNKLAAMRGQPSVQPENGKLTLAQPFGTDVKRNGIVKGSINGKEEEYEISGLVDIKVMNWLQSNYFTFVMDDFSFVKLLSSVPEDKLFVMYGFELSDWENTAATAEKLKKLVPEELQGQIDFRRASNYEAMQEAVALTLFIGMFISLLFFIASGSMIYFKLFTELQEDQAQFKALTRIGMTKSEIRKIVVSQIGMVFFIPVIVGISHALFAMKALDNMLESSNWFYSFVVIGIYIVMQTLYFLVACSSYMKSMLRGASA